uniref:Uncharacterized protein n=1 Tax=Thermocrinis ruber TaxID=75906 RepID=A0A7C5X0S2_9AQUI
MEKKGKITVYLPQKLYIEIYERHLDHHFSLLVSWLVEEFIKATDARISWAEMPSKADQRAYIERKVREFVSRAGVSSEPPKPPVQERTEPIHVQERPKDNYSATKPEPVKEERTAPPKKEDDFEVNEEVLRRLENFW